MSNYPFETFPLTKKIGIVNPISNLDARYGPWPTFNDALTSFDPSIREIGLTVAVTGVGGVREYWYKNGVGDSDLVLKLDDTIVDSETAVLVSGAGSTIVNGTYIESGESFGKKSYLKSETNGSISWNGSSWAISMPSVGIYQSFEDVEFPWQVNTWTVVSGELPVPTLTPITPTDNFTNTTFSELTSLKANNELVPGKYYRISDFQLMWWNQSVNDATVKMGLSAEPLIVLALSGDKISHEAKSEVYPQDTIYYDVDAISSYSWGTANTDTAIPNFKGWIYRRIDHKLNIDIPWDWRHITVNCCRPDMSSISLYSSSSTYNLYDVVKNASDKLYYSIQDSNTGNSLTTTDRWLPVSDFTEGLTYFVTDESYGFRASNKNGYFVNLPADTSTRIQQPTFTSSLVSQGTFQLTNCNNIKIESGHSNVFLGSNIYSNTIGNNFYSNTIGNNFFFNTIGNNFYSNTIGNFFYSNTIGSFFYNNTIGNTFYYNTIGNTFYYNTIGNPFYYNTIGNNFYSNTIGTNFFNNTIRNTFFNNTIGNSLYYNTIGSFFYNNNIGTSIYYNTIANNFNTNTIGNTFHTNTIGNNFFNNTIGNNFNTNTIGNVFEFNTIGNTFRRNTIEDSNSIENVTGATHIYNNYNTRIFSNSDNTVRLSYFNSSDQLVVTDPTA